MLYKDKLYPDYLKDGNACQYIAPIAKKFCKGKGIDVGCGDFPFEDAYPLDLKHGLDAYDLPDYYDYVFSSHCLEHLGNPVKALEHWMDRIKDGGVLFLYLPHPDMEYWLPQNCRKHLHSWYPEEIKKLLIDLGLGNVMVSERDLNWSFAAVGYVRLP